MLLHLQYQLPTTISPIHYRMRGAQMVRDRVTVSGGVGTYPPPLEAEALLPLGNRGELVVCKRCAKTREQTSLAGMRRERG